jgi:UDP-glucose:(heptosyl)LPS alpha-1,3-glucosyltransferase
MDIALCHPAVLPARGGAETYIGDLARHMARDGHRVHLVASEWDAAALPAATHFHRVEPVKGPRFLRPWRFSAACDRVLKSLQADISIGFDKVAGPDVLYPQGGLHAATAIQNRVKHGSRVVRATADIGKFLDLANHSYHQFEYRQYFDEPRPRVVVNSRMVQRHFEQLYGVPPDVVTVLHSAIDPARFAAHDRFAIRDVERSQWGVTPDMPVGLFVAMNYRLKGLEPLIRSLPRMREQSFRLVVVGHPDYARYAKLASELNVSQRVTFLGPRRDPKSVYFAADFLVHPTFYDPCSLVALEAVACGLPVITTVFNGAAELLDDDCGLVIDSPHDADALATALDTFCDPDRRNRGASAARSAAQAWTFHDHYRSLMAILGDRQVMKQAA